MRRIKVTAYFGSLSFSMFLLASIASTPTLHAQNAPAAGTTVAVRMTDAVDSNNDPAGKQYRASVTKAVNAANGVTIAQGAAATVTLASSGSGWTAQLSSVTINGQAVAVTSSSASVTSSAQSAAGTAANAVNSVLGGFGHHTNATAAVSAVATGQRVLLPPGTTLTFALSQPPALNSAPTVQPLAASAAPAPSPAATSSASASGGVTTLVVCYSNINTLYLSAAFEAPADRYGDATLAFSNYLQAAYQYSRGVKCLPMFTTTGVGDAQKQLAGFAAQLKPIDTGWRLGQPPLAQGQSGYDPLAQGPGGIDLTQHRLTTYFCSLTAPGGTTMAVDLNKPNWNADETTYVSQVFQADWNPAPVSMAYKVYIRDHYVHDLNPSANLRSKLRRTEPGAPGVDASNRDDIEQADREISPGGFHLHARRSRGRKRSGGPGRSGSHGSSYANRGSKSELRVLPLSVGRRYDRARRHGDVCQRYLPGRHATASGARARTPCSTSECQWGSDQQDQCAPNLLLYVPPETIWLQGFRQLSHHLRDKLSAYRRGTPVCAK